MRVRVERTFITTPSGTRVLEGRPEVVLVEALTLSAALLRYVETDGGRLLGTISETESRAVATAWKDGVYVVTAEPAAD